MIALPHKKSYPKGTMPQNKILTQINPADEGSEGYMGFSMKEKQTLTREYAPPYRQAENRKRKTEILDEYIRLTGYHRKYAMTLLARWGKTTLIMVGGKPVTLKAGTAKRRKGGGRKPVYGPRLLHLLFKEYGKQIVRVHSGNELSFGTGDFLFTSLSDFLCNWQNSIRTEPVLFLASMASWLSAKPQCLIGMVHFSDAFRIAQYSILNRASPVEKVERFLVTLRN
jgi:hypothetical protein